MPVAAAKRRQAGAAAPDGCTASRLAGLPPVWDGRTRVLVLGSFPGVASLAAGQYYAHPRNHFWPLLGAVLGLPLPALQYSERIAAILAAGVGLWDVIVGCERLGSLDGSIRLPEWGDPGLARRCAPSLRQVVFNGQTAARAAARWQAAGYRVAALPSTSPAYTRPFAEKLAAWRILVGSASGMEGVQ